MNIFHAFGRNFLFLTSLVLTKITIWINLVRLFSADGTLLHDVLSKSAVVKR